MSNDYEGHAAQVRETGAIAEVKSCVQSKHGGAVSMMRLAIISSLITSCVLKTQPDDNAEEARTREEIVPASNAWADSVSPEAAVNQRLWGQVAARHSLADVAEDDSFSGTLVVPFGVAAKLVEAANEIFTRLIVAPNLVMRQTAIAVCAFDAGHRQCAVFNHFKMLQMSFHCFSVHSDCLHLNSDS